MTDNPDDGTLIRLLTWLSPAFPVGGFAFSHGIEMAIADGVIRGRETLREWIAFVLRYGSGRIDGALLAAAHRAAADGDGERLMVVADRADAFRATAELALESRVQGAAFLKAVASAWPALSAGNAALTALGRRSAPPAYGVAVGAVTAAAGLPPRPVLLAFLAAFAGGLVSAGVRLIPIGQTDGLRVTAALEGVIAGAAEAVAATAIAALASAAWMADLCSARHETQPVRLFRS